jgi:DNA-binding transcriptional LysR family regulator
MPTRSPAVRRTRRAAPTTPAPAAGVQAFDWGLVRSFVAVLDAGSVMAAARASNTQQPTLSRHIAALEAQLGVALFERTGRGVQPTAVALALADASRGMAAQASALQHVLTRQTEARSGSVRITTSQVAASYLLPPVLAALAQAEPGIQVELVASNQVNNLLRREADIAVRMLRPEQGSLLARKLGELPITAAAHERYLQAHGAPQRPEQLREHRLIGYDRDETILRGFAAMGLPLQRSDFHLRTDDQVTYGRLIAAGAGIGFLAAYNLRHLAGVRPLLSSLKIPPLPCWLAVHREIKGNPVVRRVFDFLAENLPAQLER